MPHTPLDRTRPGPAGLFFDRTLLTPAGLQADLTAAATLESWCPYCSLWASHGHGVFKGNPGITTCSNHECIAQAERDLACGGAERGRQRALDAPAETAPAKPAEPVTNLFSGLGEAA